MTADTAKEITQAPQTYNDWLDCFDVLQHKNVTKDELKLLGMGRCTASRESVEFLEKQLIKTLNVMIKRYIKAFNKDLQMHMLYNEYDDLYRLFSGLAARFNGCLFFTGLGFLGTEFRRELRDSVVCEIRRFWDSMIASLYAQCIEHNDRSLEDVLYMMKRITLFKGQEIYS